MCSTTCSFASLMHSTNVALFQFRCCVSCFSLQFFNITFQLHAYIWALGLLEVYELVHSCSLPDFPVNTFNPRCSLGHRQFSHIQTYSAFVNLTISLVQLKHYFIIEHKSSYERNDRGLLGGFDRVYIQV